MFFLQFIQAEKEVNGDFTGDLLFHGILKKKQKRAKNMKKKEKQSKSNLFKILKL
jgi:hypothetical protein